MKEENIATFIIFGFYAALLIAGVGGYLLGVVVTKNKWDKEREEQASRRLTPTRTFTRRNV